MNTDRLRIVTQVLCLALELRAMRIRLTCARERSLDHLAGRDHNLHLDTAERHRVAGRHDRASGGTIQVAIGTVDVSPHMLAVVGRRPVVDVVPDGDSRRQLLQTAVVIGVPVSRDHVINLPQPGVLDGRHDATDVAVRVLAGIAGIHEHRFARR